MPAPPASDSNAAKVFGLRLQLAERYAQLLATAGVERGLIGPREVDRLWERHLLNCAVVTDLVPPSARVVDVGSGAGLPGLAMAIRRPDLSVDLVESLGRRTSFLDQAVDLLGVADQVRVVRGRAEDAQVRSAVGEAGWVTARAVAPLDRLMRWCLPLLAPGGSLLAVKGERAAAELKEFGALVARLGGAEAEVVTCGSDLLGSPVRVVVIRKQHRSGQSRRGISE
jgi:16S rRNA (guanine527-N7)-methyltransferase